MNNNLTFSLVIFALLLSMGTLSAQEQQNHEMGLRMGGLNNFGFIYKKQKDENRYLRYRLGSLNFGYDTQKDIRELPVPEDQEAIERRFNSGLTFGIGFENRVQVTDKLMFIHGWEPRASINYTSTTEEETGSEKETSNYFAGSLGIGYILGFQMPISDHFQISIETIPALTFQYQYNDLSETRDIHNTSTDFGFNANWISLSVMYRFSTQ